MAEERIALVTGGTRGIGLAIARRLAADGMDVWTCCKTNLEDLDDKPPFPERHVIADLRSPAQAVERIAERIPQVDVLVNNAGVGTAALMAETSPEFVDEMFAVNLAAPIQLMRHYVPGMVEAGHGRVINISSISGKFGNTGRLAYASSKHGLIGATRCVSDEVAGQGVTVNTVCPGPTDTKMLQEIGADDPGFFAKVTSRIKIGRLVRPEEIASMVAYLCSDDAAPITGQSLVVDGGVIQS